MADDSPLIREERQRVFHPYTRALLIASNGQTKKENGTTDESKKTSADKEQGVGRNRAADSKPDRLLEQGARLPVRMRNAFPAELTSTAIEDFDPFYKNKKTFVVVNRSRNIFRFSAENALWMLSPFSPIRRVALYAAVQPAFSCFIMAVILVHCVCMIMPYTPVLGILDLVFLSIYTIEVVIKVLARGFLLHPFAYLRDPWNWLDFFVTLVGYISFGIDVGALYVLRTFRVLRSWRTVTIIPGWKAIVGAVSQSLRNMKDLIILLLFSLFVLAVLGLQIYMGVLTHKCVKHFPTDGSSGVVTDENWFHFCSNRSNWYIPEDYYEYPLCGNSSGAGVCPPNYTCLQGFGENPNYGYTSFDTFGWSLLSVFRLVTQDYWENLYQLTLRSAGPWHMLFFIIVVIYGSFCFLNFILALVVMSYNEAQKRSDEEDAAEKEAKEELKKTSNAANNAENGQAQTTLEISDEAVLKDNTNQPQVQQDEPGCSGRTALLRVVDLLCVWDCCPPLQRALSAVVLHPFFELFIAVCIVLNTAAMAADHHDMIRDLERVLYTANYVFTMIYIIEAILKNLALSPKFYFKDQWNTFDFVIVLFAILEMTLEGVQGLSVFRSFRLLRVFRLARFWPTLNKFIGVMDKSFGAFINVMYVMFILLFIFAAIGMQLFGRAYIDNVEFFPDGDIPRWNFTDFMHSFMIVFRAFCGEWIESMWDCMLVGDASCIPFFVIVFFLGNFIILNLLVALLLHHYSSFCMSTPTAENEDSKISDVCSQISRFFKRLKPNLIVVKMSPMKSDSDDIVESQENNVSGSDNVFIADYPPDCCCGAFYKCCPLLPTREGSAVMGVWKKVRRTCFSIAKNKYFNIFVTVVVIVGCIFLTFRDVNFLQRRTLALITIHFDFYLSVVFIVEMLIMWFAVGLRKYFTSGWYLLDFIVTVIHSLDMFVVFPGMHNIYAVRIFRLIRPLSRRKGMKVVMNTLVEAIPHMLNVALVGLFFWLVFAIMGVQLFAGKFYKCVDINSTILSHEIIMDRNACINENYSWVNSPMNFDHVGNAYLSLLQVATFKGWIQIMNDAIDSREVHKQPIRETNIYMYIYFIFFIIFGSFFILKLFTCVLIDVFREQRNKAGDKPTSGGENQGVYRRTLDKIASKKPVKRIPKPTCYPQSLLYDISVNKKFEFTMMALIILNVAIMAFDHYQMSQIFSEVLDYTNFVFIIIFLLECVLKISGLRHHYFKNAWNVIDFLYVVLSILGLALNDLLEKYFMSPTLLRIVRILRVGRLMRHFRCARGMRLMLLALERALPTLFNVSLLLFYVLFIYAVFGMGFFMYVRERAAIDDVYNFRTFGQSMILLFQLATSAGWDGVYEAIANEEECQQVYHETGYIGDCGSKPLAIVYLVSFLVITCMVVVNMYAAVILGYVLEIFEDEKEGLTDDDLDMFYDAWQRLDPEASQYIRYDQLSDLLDDLEPPLRVPKPNKYKIPSLNIPICKDDQIFCKDVLDALAKDVFARKGGSTRPQIAEAWGQAQTQAQADYEPVSSTMQRQREEYCVRLIQNAWRKHKQQS